MRGIMWLRFCTRHPGLTLDGFEHVVDWEFQLDKVVIHLVSSEWALLRVWEWSLLESALPVTLVVDGGISVLRLRLAPSSPRLKDELVELFIVSSNWMHGWAQYMTLLQRVTMYFTRCLYNGWVTRGPLMNVRAQASSLQSCILASWFCK